MVSGNFYFEQQRFNQKWVTVIIYIAVLISILTTIFFIYQDSTPFFLSILPLIIGAALYIMVIGARLKIEVDANEIRYQFWPFHFTKRIISRSNVDSIAVITYAPLSDYGGWGIRIGKSGWAYTTSGHFGLSINRKGGKNILIGTGQPGELSTFLEARWNSLFKS